LRCVPLRTSLSFPDTPSPEISPLSLHDALPISSEGFCVASCEVAFREGSGVGRGVGRGLGLGRDGLVEVGEDGAQDQRDREEREDRKSTRLNSSHVSISYAVFCLKKKTAAGELP